MRIFPAWLPMIFIAALNGSFRQFVLLNRLGELRAHQVSTILLIFLCGMYTWLIFPRLHIRHRTDALIAGFIWVLLTVGFEFGFGRQVSFLDNHKSPNLGNIWRFCSITLFLISPKI